MAESLSEIFDKLERRLGTDPDYRRQFGEQVLGRLVLDRLFELKARVAELEQGGADGDLTKQLAEARERIAELEEQLRGRGEEEGGEDEHRPFWEIVTAEIKRLPSQAIASLDEETHKLLRHRAGGILSAHLRGDFNRTDFRKRLKDQLQEIASGADRAPAVRRTSPTPAPAGASSQAQGFNLKE